MNGQAVEVQNLSRVYETTVGVFRRKRRQVLALEDVSFSIGSGELFGLVGPNGAGKTTLIKVLTTYLLPTGGSAKVLGYDVAREERPIRKRINVVFGGDRGLYPRLSAEDNLKYFADIYQVPREVSVKRVPQLLEMLGLKGREQERVEGYSRGMKQRLHIAKALINDPEVLFLDEPTIGLDPAASRNLRTTIADISALGKTIILTSHYMYEVDVLCKRVAVINKGTLKTIDTPSNLKRFVAGLFVVESQVTHGALDPSLVEQIKGLSGVEGVDTTATGEFQNLVVRTRVPDLVTSALRERLSEQDLSYVVVREPTLEDAYIKLIGAEG